MPDGSRQPADETGIIRQNVLWAFSIPVIVRLDAPDVRASLENVRVQYRAKPSDGAALPRKTPILVFDLVRLGSSSLFGNLEVRKPGERADEQLALLRGVAVYPEINRRRIELPLSRDLLDGEVLEVKFTDDDTAPGTILARHVHRVATVTLAHASNWTGGVARTATGLRLGPIRPNPARP